MCVCECVLMFVCACGCVGVCACVNTNTVVFLSSHLKIEDLSVLCRCLSVPVDKGLMVSF